MTGPVNANEVKRLKRAAGADVDTAGMRNLDISLALGLLSGHCLAERFATRSRREKPRWVSSALSI